MGKAYKDLVKQLGFLPKDGAVGIYSKNTNSILVIA